jgi:hypothetical protein
MPLDVPVIRTDRICSPWRREDQYPLGRLNRLEGILRLLVPGHWAIWDSRASNDDVRTLV